MPNPADLSIYQGDDWAATVTVTHQDLSPVDLTGYTAQAQVRTGPADQEPDVAAEIQSTIQLPNLVLLSLSSAQTTALTGTIYYWDLQIVSPAPYNQTLTVLAGKVRVTQEITRESGAGAARIRRIA